MIVVCHGFCQLHQTDPSDAVGDHANFGNKAVGGHLNKKIKLADRVGVHSKGELKAGVKGDVISRPEDLAKSTK